MEISWAAESLRLAESQRDAAEPPERDVAGYCTHCGDAIRRRSAVLFSGPDMLHPECRNDYLLNASADGDFGDYIYNQELFAEFGAWCVEQIDLRRGLGESAYEDFCTQADFRSGFLQWFGDRAGLWLGEA